MNYLFIIILVFQCFIFSYCDVENIRIINNQYDQLIYNHYGNSMLSMLSMGNLEQYLQYEVLTKDILSNYLHEDLLFKDWNKCINDLSISFKKEKCTEINRQKIKNIISSHPLVSIPRKLNDDNLRFIPNCQYNIPSTFDSIVQWSKKEWGFFFIIKTISCSSEIDSRYQGGASFSIYAKTFKEQVMCNVRDNFSGSYFIFCNFHHLLHDNQNYSQSNDVIVTIYLDYEHFDAFSEIYGSSPPMQYKLFQGTLFSFSNIQLKNPNDIRHIPLEDRFQLFKEKKYYQNQGYWLKRIHPFEKVLFNYEWSGKGKIYLNATEFHHQFMDTNKRMTFLFGPSHMRFLWDWIFYLYFGAEKLAKLDRKHNDNNDIPGLSYTSVKYSTLLVDKIQSIQCDQQGNKKKTTIVFQFGSWDLNALSLRALIRNPSAASRVLETIRNLTLRNDCSSSQLRLVWQSSMPYPKCIRSDFLRKLGLDGDVTSCEKSRGFRNNYAISAFNQWFYRQLDEISSNMVTMIDTSDIIAPRLDEQETSSCGNHFLFHPKDTIMMTTLVGIAATGEMLQCVLWDDKHDYCHVQKSVSLSSEDSHAKLQLVEVNSNKETKQWFIIEGNIIRKLHDKETFECLSKNIKEKLILESVDDISLFAIDNREFPSRANNTVLISQTNHKNRYIIKNCERYDLSSNTEFHHGKVMDYDINNIPIV